MGKSDIEIAVLRHRRARIRELRHRQILDAPAVLPPEIITNMAQTTYNVATEGDINGFVVLVREDNGVRVLTEVTPQRNTILHLAAIYGHIQLLVHIINHELHVLRIGTPMPNDYQGLLLRPNSNGNFPLHVAAAAGNELVVNVLINHLEGVQDVWVMQNNEGNTVRT